MRWRCLVVAGPLACTAALAACGGGASPTARPDPRGWLSIDAGARRASITLIAAYDAAYGGFNLDGASKGALLFAVPRGWSVTVRCVNNSSTRRYACELQRAPGAGVSGRAPGAPAPGPTAPTSGLPIGRLQPAGGLAPGRQASFSFPAGAPARYRLAAVTGGVRPAGMWVTLEVASGGRPRVRWVR
jgi:Sulfocyanin (SoxE) domain